MPVEVYSLEEFMEIAKRAIECRVKKNKNSKYVKFKARTRRYLYTLKVDKDKADELVNKLPCSKIVIIDEKGNTKVIEKKS